MIPKENDRIEFKLIHNNIILSGNVVKWGLESSGVYWLVIKDNPEEDNTLINISQISYMRIVKEEEQGEPLKHDPDSYKTNKKIPDEYKRNIKENIDEIVTITKDNVSSLRKEVANVLNNKSVKKLGFRYEVPNFTKYTKK